MENFLLKPLAFVSIFLISVLAISCSSDSSPTVITLASEADTGSLRVLDISNEQIRRDIRTLLAQTGDTAERSPQLFKRLNGDFGGKAPISESNPVVSLNAQISEQLFSSDGRFSFTVSFRQTKNSLYLLLYLLF